jgi:hypothetical protein
MDELLFDNISYYFAMADIKWLPFLLFSPSWPLSLNYLTAPDIPAKNLSLSRLRY